MALDFGASKLLSINLFIVLTFIAVASTSTDLARPEGRITTDHTTDRHHRSYQTTDYTNSRPSNFVNNDLTSDPNWKVSQRLVGGHVRMDVTTKHTSIPNENDDEAKWDDGLIISSAGNGKEKSSVRSNDDDEKKTLSQQVKEGKYGLIQNEIYPTKSKRPGIISYLSNPDVPRDNAKNLGGLDEDDIWLAENHVLVLRGGNFPINDSDRREANKKTDFTPIDDYEAPRRQVKIPPRPKVPPPFPVQLSDNAPLQIIGVDGTFPIVDDSKSKSKKDFTSSPFVVTSGNATTKSEDLTSQENSTKKLSENEDSGNSDGRKKSDVVSQGGLIGPFFPSLPEGAVFVLPPGNRTDYDEDDQSLYYPPPYSFYYEQDNSTPVPPGPLVPGIILPPPPDFFARQEEKKPTSKVNYRKYTKRPVATTLPGTRPTVQPPRKSTTKTYKQAKITVTTVKPRVTPHQALYYFYEEAKDDARLTVTTKSTTESKSDHRSTTPTPYRKIPITPKRTDHPKKSSHDDNANLVTPVTLKNFDVELLDSTPKTPTRYRYPKPTANNRQSYTDRDSKIVTAKPETFDEWKDYREKIRNDKQYVYDEIDDQNERQNRRYKNRLPIVYPTSTIRSIIETTPNPQHAYYTKQDEQLLDDATKQFFNNFGKKLRGESLPSTTPIYGKTGGVTSRPVYSETESYETNDYDDDRRTVTHKPNRVRVHYGDSTVRPYSLEDDTRVNYQNPLPPINPDSEWITELNTKPIVDVPSPNDAAGLYYKDTLPPVDSTVEWLSDLRNKQPEDVSSGDRDQIYYKEQLPRVNQEWITELNSKLRENGAPVRGDNPTTNYRQPSEPIDQTGKWLSQLGSEQPTGVPLDDDIRVNYRDPLPPVNPDAEWIPGYGPEQPFNVPLQNYRNQQTQLRNQNYIQRNLTSLRLSALDDYQGRRKVQQRPNGLPINYVAVGDNRENEGEDNGGRVDYSGRPDHDINANYPTRPKPIGPNYNGNYQVATKSWGHQINGNYQSRPFYANDDVNGNYAVRPGSSMADDVKVNYQNPIPPINPDAEFVDTGIIRNDGTDKSYYRSISYPLPGDGGHFYFLTPHPINQPQNRNGGYLYPRPRGPRLSRRRKRGPDNN